MEGLTIRPLGRSDAAAVEHIVAFSPEAARWSPEGYLALPGWVAEEGDGVEGFLFARVAADEMEILNLAVEPAARERGAGSALLAAAFDYGRQAGAARAFLEVRESNLRARRFYQQRGFTVSGRRPRYYHHPVEDAVVMSCSFAVAP